MKLLVSVLIVIVLGIGVAAWLLSARTQRGVQCPDRVMIFRGRGAAPLECICVDGVLATCFAPGP